MKLLAGTRENELNLIENITDNKIQTKNSCRQLSQADDSHQLVPSGHSPDNVAILEAEQAPDEGSASEPGSSQQGAQLGEKTIVQISRNFISESVASSSKGSQELIKSPLQIMKASDRFENIPSAT